MHAMSHRVKEIRQVESTHMKFLITLERNPRSSKLAKSFSKSQIYSCKSWTCAAMNANRNLCETNALLNDCEDQFQGIGPIDLCTQVNYDILFDPQILQKYYDLQVNKKVIKQRTSMWHELQKKKSKGDRQHML